MGGIRGRRFLLEVENLSFFFGDGAGSTKLLLGFYARKAMCLAPKTGRPIHRVDVNVEKQQKIHRGAGSSWAAPDAFECI